MSGTHSPAVWFGFSALVAVLLFVDLFVLNRKSHVLTTREAATWSGTLVVLAFAFAGFLWWREGFTHALEFTTGYLVELSLSVDNLFVFILIFQYFAVPAEAQPKVLKWGIIGALVMRAVMIALGALMLERFHWVIYVFGGVLILTGIKMLIQKEERIEPEKNPLVRLAKRFLPFSPAYDGDRFTTTSGTGRRYFTPLVLVLIVVEWTDLVFAIDSIPAVFAVTKDPFLVYSSNVFAIIGLRALFFLLAGALDSFRYLKTGVAGVLVFVGVKMAISAWVKVPTAASLGVIVAALAAAVIASQVANRRDAAAAA